MYESMDSPWKKIVSNILKVAVDPKQRPYQTNNFYAALKRQEMLDKEVYDIVHVMKSWLRRLGWEKPEERPHPVKTKKKPSCADKKYDRVAYCPRQPHGQKGKIGDRTVSL